MMSWAITRSQQHAKPGLFKQSPLKGAVIQIVTDIFVYLQECVDSPTLYDWLYLTFHVVFVLVLHFFFIDFCARRRSFTRFCNIFYLNHIFRWKVYQILAKWGPDSSFVIETNTKSRWPKSSWSRIVKLMDRGWVTQPRVEYWVEYQVKYLVKYWI